jgi:hypothetical protein
MGKRGWRSRGLLFSTTTSQLLFMQRIPRDKIPDSYQPACSVLHQPGFQPAHAPLQRSEACVSSVSFPNPAVPGTSYCYVLSRIDLLAHCGPLVSPVSPHFSIDRRSARFTWYWANMLASLSWVIPVLVSLLSTPCLLSRFLFCFCSFPSLGLLNNSWVVGHAEPFLAELPRLSLFITRFGIGDYEVQYLFDRPSIPRNFWPCLCRLGGRAWSYYWVLSALSAVFRAICKIHHGTSAPEHR